MSARETTKLEYILQPHMVILLLIVFACIAGAIATAAVRVRDAAELANMETSQACKQYISDEILCKYIAKDQSSIDDSYVLTSNVIDDENEQTAIIQAENSRRNSSKTILNGEIIDETIQIDQDIYIKDYTDNTWAHYQDSEYSEEVIKYDFSQESSEDVQLLKNHYFFEAMEECGVMSCYKYKITNPDDSTSQTYIWFDNQEFLTRRILTIDSNSTSNMSFEYKVVTIEAPTATKNISQDEIDSFMQDFSSKYGDVNSL